MPTPIEGDAEGNATAGAARERLRRASAGDAFPGESFFRAALSGGRYVELIDDLAALIDPVLLETARAALAFISSCVAIPDLGYPIDDARHAAKHACMAIVREADRDARDELERDLVGWLDVAGLTPRVGDAFQLMAEIGTRRSFEAMRRFVARDAAEDCFTTPYLPPLWAGILRWLERHDFAPDLVRALNETIAGQRGRPDFMHAYHRQLTEYGARFAHWTGLRLHDRLAPGGVQLWDYWMTYAPEAAQA